MRNWSSTLRRKRTMQIRRNASERVKFGSDKLISIMIQLCLESDSFKSAHCWNMHVSSHSEQGLMSNTVSMQAVVCMKEMKRLLTNIYIFDLWIQIEPWVSPWHCMHHTCWYIKDGWINKSLVSNYLTLSVLMHTHSQHWLKIGGVCNDRSLAYFLLGCYNCRYLLVFLCPYYNIWGCTTVLMRVANSTFDSLKSYCNFCFIL